MSHPARREYLNAILERYRSSNRSEKARILDEFCLVCGYTRKYAIRLLGRGHAPFPSRRGRPSLYAPHEVMPWLYRLWLRMGKMNSKRMKEAMPEWLESFPGAGLTPFLKEKLLKMSAATIERLLKRARLKVRGITSTRPSKRFLSKIPLQPKDWNVVRPGTVQADTVAHTHTTLDGTFAYTLTVTDIHTGWTENRAIFGKATSAMMIAIADIERDLPFKLETFKSDSGSEFMNQRMYQYFRERNNAVHFVRSRPYRKNDNCYVEQKNFTHVREIFGYVKIEDPKMIEWMNRIYEDLWNPLANLFMPSTKLLRKSRIGSRIKKEYDRPQTPYDRILACESVSELEKQRLKVRKARLNPWELSERLEQELKAFQQSVRNYWNKAA